VRRAGHKQRTERDCEAQINANYSHHSRSILYKRPG